jgi:hypothetical protein
MQVICTSCMVATHVQSILCTHEVSRVQRIECTTMFWNVGNRIQ